MTWTPLKSQPPATTSIVTVSGTYKSSLDFNVYFVGNNQIGSEMGWFTMSFVYYSVVMLGIEVLKQPRLLLVNTVQL